MKEIDAPGELRLIATTTTTTTRRLYSLYIKRQVQKGGINGFYTKDE